MHAPAEYLRRLVRRLTPRSVYLKLATAYGAQASARRIGHAEYSRLREVACADSSGEPVAFQVPGLAHSVLVRPGTSDADVFEGSLLRESYGALRPSSPVRLIIDAGANAGYGTVLFLNRYPGAKVIAVEPDPQNYALAGKNLAPYGERVELIQGAVWPTRAKLRVETCGQADATRVVAVEGDADCDCQGYDLLGILNRSGESRISIFKCDIEGAEEQLFQERCDPWLQKTDSIVMEIHHARTHQAVYEAVRRHPFEFFVNREVHVFVRR